MLPSVALRDNKAENKREREKLNNPIDQLFLIKIEGTVLKMQCDGRNVYSK